MIDEKKLIHNIKEWSKEKEIKWTSESVISLLESVPKVNGWIPCEERLPEEPFSCLVTVIDSHFNGTDFEDFENILPYFVGYSDGQWNDPDGEQIPFEVVAWQSVPEPYRG